MSTSGKWQFFVDRGGTFTDIVARKPDGSLITAKLLSENRHAYKDAAIAGIADLMGVSRDAPLPTQQIESVKMGTTVATNALLERKGDRVLLLTTEGFADCLEIGYQARRKVFALRIEKPSLLYAKVAALPERVRADGTVELPLDLAATREALAAAKADGIEAVAILLMHSYAYPSHERQAADLAREMGFTQISASHAVSPLVKLVGRGDTTVVDAYLSPLLRRYVAQVADALKAVRAGPAQSPLPGGKGSQRLSGSSSQGRRDPAKRAGTVPRAQVIQGQPAAEEAAIDGQAKSGHDENEQADATGPRLLFMQSSGGLTSAGLFQGKDAILSGPAGGVIGAVETARLAGYRQVIGFDMGGTSTDVCHYDGAYERSFDSEVAGVRVRVPMMLVQTVAAGGGSILAYDGARFGVGPGSAGADPGPTCYRRGGPLTITDANVMTGKLLPDFFPKIFGPGQDEALDADSVRAAFGELAERVGDGRSAEEVAEGFIRIGVENMANAIKTISVQRGHEVSNYLLNCFGGAGGQHGCLVADALGIEAVLIHPFSSLLSAYGIGLAEIRADRSQAVLEALNAEGVRKAYEIAGRLQSAAVDELLTQGLAAESLRVTYKLQLRYLGTDSALEVAAPAPSEGAKSGIISEGAAGLVERLIQRFEATHRMRFGFVSREKPIEIEVIEVEAEGGGAKHEEPRLPLSGAPLGEAERTTFVFTGGERRETPVYRRRQLKPGQMLSGPALIIEDHQTVVVEPGWQAQLTERDHLLLTKVAETHGDGDVGTEADPVMLEVFNNLFASAAEQMGHALQNTARSVNIKERLDFSCAIFDAGGGLVANAPHIPVHLGSMDRSVETVIRELGDALRPGDVYMLNAPYNGGTHLPDITVVTPVFDEGGEAILFYVASRGHHADVGGSAPGSMSPNATTIEEEGVYIDPFKLVTDGVFLEEAVDRLLTEAPYPARNPEQNIADLKAQAAANEKGVQELRKLVRQFGLEVVQAYMRHVQDNAAASVEQVIAELEPGAFCVTTDQGSTIKVAISVDKQARRATVDFTGTSQQQPDNFNAPEPITRAAVLYVFRTLVGEEIPLNAGCLRPIEIVVPEGSMLKPVYPAAVVAGNVETSQQIVNCLYGALGLLGSAQGTMNNLTFGNGRYQYYETICSGAPAGPGFDGAAAVQTHMTNSRLTDPEVLELRYPVLLEEFSIRRGSGGRGRWRAGDGTRRVIRFLEEMACAILSGARTVPPFGVDGGEPGETGENAVRRNSGDFEALKACDQTVLAPGEAILIKTPTGGGFGRARPRS